MDRDPLDQRGPGVLQGAEEDVDSNLLLHFPRKDEHDLVLRAQLVLEVTTCLDLVTS
jgi:hypothetical protein